MANASGFLRVYNGLTIKLSSNTPSGQGDIVSDSSTGNLLYHNGTTSAALASASNTITLTNKSIDASANTLTNIANAAIAAGAAIAYSKLNLAGSVVNADIATGAAIAYTKLNLATSIVNADISASAAIAYSKLTLTGSIVNTDIGASAAIAHSKMAALSTSKIAATDSSGFVTTTNGVVPVTAKGDLIVGSGAATASTLTVGADGTTPVADSGATTGIRWATQQQGNKNYITYNNFENGATTGWTLCNVGTLTNGLPTGTSPNFSFATGNLAISVVSSGQLAGTKSLQALMTAASTVGDGVATQAYTIDAEDQAKVLGFRFAYKASANATNANFSGTSSNSFGVAVWDATNSVFIPVAGAFNLVQSSGVGIATGTFQTASNTASIRFVIYNVTATAGAVTMLYDDFFCGPQVTSMGAAMSDPVSFTPTGSWTTNTTYSGFWHREGKFAVLDYLLTLSGAPTAANLTLNVPFGWQIDSSAMTGASVDLYSMDGRGTARTTNSFDVVADYHSSTSISVLCLSTSATQLAQSAFVNATTPSTFGSGHSVQVTVRVPIVGWSSNTVQSADSDSRVIAMRATGAPPTGTLGAGFNAVTFPTIASDTAGGLSGSTYTIPVSGYYNISAGLGISGTFTAGGASQINIFNSKTSVSIATSGQRAWGSVTTDFRINTSANGVLLNAGDTIQIRSYTDGTSASYNGSSDLNWFTITRCSGPAVVQATESVNGFYSTLSSTSTTTGTALNWTSKVRDTHGAYTSGTIKIPVSGFYEFNGGATWSSAACDLNFTVNGSQITSITTIAGGNRQSWAIGYPLNAGDLVTITAGASITLGTTNGYISWARVGN